MISEPRPWGQDKLRDRLTRNKCDTSWMLGKSITDRYTRAWTNLSTKDYWTRDKLINQWGGQMKLAVFKHIRSKD